MHGGTQRLAVQKKNIGNCGGRRQGVVTSPNCTASCTVHVQAGHAMDGCVMPNFLAHEALSSPPPYSCAHPPIPPILRPTDAGATFACMWRLLDCPAQSPAAKVQLGSSRCVMTSEPPRTRYIDGAGQQETRQERPCRRCAVLDLIPGRRVILPYQADSSNTARVMQ